MPGGETKGLAEISDRLMHEMGANCANSFLTLKISTAGPLTVYGMHGYQQDAAAPDNVALDRRLPEALPRLHTEAGRLGRAPHTPRLPAGPRRPARAADGEGK